MALHDAYSSGRIEGDLSNPPQAASCASLLSFELLSVTCSLCSEHLALFLGKQWLYDDQIDAGLSLIQQNLPSSMHIAFADMLFMVQLCLARKWHITYIPHPEKAMDQALLQGHVDKLEVPVNPGGTHWAGIQVDLQAHTFHYWDIFFQLSRGSHTLI